LNQRFTVDLEMTTVMRATVDVMAADIAEARIKAIEKARGRHDIWTLNREAEHVVKITAHANEPPVEPPPYGSTELWRLARKHRRSK
jgi:hypothetical protein